MATVKNVTSGPKGAYFEGSLVMVDPGQEAKADDYSPEWFEPVKADKPSDGGKTKGA